VLGSFKSNNFAAGDNAIARFSNAHFQSYASNSHSKVESFCLNLQICRGQSILLRPSTNSQEKALLNYFHGIPTLNVGSICINGTYGWPLGTLKVFSEYLTIHENICVFRYTYGSSVDLEDIYSAALYRSRLGLPAGNVLFRSLPRHIKLALSIYICLKLDFDFYIMPSRWIGVSLTRASLKDSLREFLPILFHLLEIRLREKAFILFTDKFLGYTITPTYSQPLAVS